jgi:putative ABC transport system permease protein
VGQVLSDVQNANQGLLTVHAGGRVRIVGADRVVWPLPVSGEGRNLDGAQSVSSDSVIVLYATVPTVAALNGGAQGYEQLYFRLADARPAAVSATEAAIRRTLAAAPGFTGFSGLPDVRATGDWPGRSSYQKFTKFFYVITILALLTALVLISNTITALVAEQTSEIGIMKAVGGRRRQIAAVYLKTALLLGALGTVVGAYPAANIAIALAGTIVLALLVTLIPIRRAVRYRPGDALRYA